MARALSLVEFEYVLKAERDLPKEEQTVWKLKPLTFAEQEIVSDQRMGTRKNSDEIVFQANLMTIARKVLNYGLMGWSNFLGADGQPIEFTVKERKGFREIPSELFDLIAPYAFELSNACTDASKLPDETSKNS